MTDIKVRLAQAYEVHGDKVRYLVVGVFNTAFAYVLFLAMLAVARATLTGMPSASLGVPRLLSDNYFLVAQWTSWVLSVPVGTATLKYLAFRSKGPYLAQLGRAYLVYLPGTIVNSAILWLTVAVMSLPPAIGQLIAIAVVTVFSYLGHKYFTFR